MTVYVDPLLAHGWVLKGRKVVSCHMFTDRADVGELHRLADAVGCRRTWFQARASTPHYDLTANRRAAAVAAGAVEVTRREAVRIWQARRQLDQKARA